MLVRTPFVSIIPPCQPHAIDGGRQSDVIVIMLDQAFYERTVHEITGDVAPDLVGRYASLDPLIREIGHLLHREFQGRSVPGDGYLTSLAAVLAVHVARNYQSIDSSGCLLGLSPEKLHRVQRFVGEHLENALTVPQLAATVHMSPFHFARMFKQATGYTPHGYVIGQRIERSKQILRESDRPLIDIAFDTGFKTQGHFTVVFHKAVGMTPRAYRRLNPRASGRPRVVLQQAGMTADWHDGKHS
jgi:AraC family transcriptional regulator